MIEGDGGLLDDDKTVKGTCFMIKAPLCLGRLIEHAQYTPFAMFKSWGNVTCNTTRKGAG
jgi:hypothetical protein